MLGVDPEIGSSALRLWVAAGSAALLVFICAMAFQWTRTRPVAHVGMVVAGAVFGAMIAWAFLDPASNRDQGAERRALELRAAELTTPALAPGSSLACLDALAGDNVEAACEKTVFAAPATVAAASSYVAARLALLADMVAYSKRGGANIDSDLLPLRRALEADRFGFVAHALAVRDGCTSDDCKALSLLRDPSRVRANLRGQSFDRYLDHYMTVWTQPSDVPVADATSSQIAATNQQGAPGQRKTVVDIDFPTADSIPPISIMNPEPKGAVPPATAAADSGVQAEPTRATAAKKSRKQAVNSAAQNLPAQNSPAQGAAPAPAATAPVDPVWGPGAAAPVQLNPSPTRAQ